jgi:hypothetical protein
MAASDTECRGSGLLASMRSLLDGAQAETLCEFAVLPQQFALERSALLASHLT